MADSERESSPPAPRPFHGTDRFEDVRVLGKGGMGEVFEAFDRDRGMRVALKALTLTDPDRIRRFKDEFRALSDMHHPNLVSFGELFEKDGSWWFTMERLHGVEFLKFVRSDSGLGASGTGSSEGNEPMSASSSQSHSTGDSRSTGDRSGLPTSTTVGAEPVASRDAPTPPSFGSGDELFDEATITGAGTATVLERPDETTIDARHSADRSTGGSVVANPANHGRAPQGFRTSWEARLRSALSQLATGLAFLHRAGMIHRDIKSSNILVEPSGRVVLLDFGLVAELTAAAREEQIVGSPAYMAPEQALGEQLTPAADWYAVGVLLYGALTGRTPFLGPPVQVMRAKIHAEPPDVRTMADDLPEDLATLCMRLLRRAPAERPSEDEILEALDADAPDAWEGPSTLADVAAPVFVGREREIAVLRDALSASASGAFVAIVLEGPSGIGKSRLAQEFADSADVPSRALKVLRGRCHEKESVRFKAFDAVMDQLAAWLGELSRRRLDAILPNHLEPLCTVFPTLRAVKAIRRRIRRTAGDGRVEQDPTELRLLAFAALRELLSKLTELGPLLLVIDDLQWADADSVALISEVFGKGPAPPLFMLATMRDAASGTGLAADALGPACRKVRVDGLDGAAAARLVSTLTREDHGRVGEREMARLVAETQGNPMLIDELMRHSRGGMGSDGGVVALDDALRARAEALGAECLELLRLVSVSTRPLSQGIIAKAAGLSPSEYASIANRLRAARFIRISGVRQVDTIEPYHSRVGEAIYAAIPDDEREARHLRLAEVLEELGGAPADIATHLFRGGAKERSVPFFEEAGDAARAGLAFERAASLYLEAATIVEGLPGYASAARRALLIAVGECYHLGGSAERAAHAFERAAETLTGERAEANQPSIEALGLLARASELYLQTGHMDEGWRAAELVLSTFGLKMPGSTVSAILQFVFYDLRLTLQRFQWEKVARDSYDERQLSLIDSYCALAGGLGMVDPLVANLFMAKGVLLSLKAGEPRRRARTLGWQASSYYALDRVKTADRLVDACRRACDEDESGRGWLYLTVASLLKTALCYNDWPEVLSLVERGRVEWQAHEEGYANELDLLYQMNCWALEQMGRVDRLGELVEGRVEWAKRRGNRFIVVTYRSHLVLPALALDEPSRALSELEAAIASWPVDPELMSLQEHMAHRSRSMIALYQNIEWPEKDSLEAGWKRFFGSLLKQTPFIRQDGHLMAGHLELAYACALRDEGKASAARSRLRRARRHASKLGSMRLPMARLAHAELMGCAAYFADDADGATTWLRAALASADALHCELRAACIAEALASLVEEPEALELRRNARAFADAVGIRRFDRIVAMHLPVFRAVPWRQI